MPGQLPKMQVRENYLEWDYQIPETIDSAWILSLGDSG